MKKKNSDNQAAVPAGQIKTTIGGQALIEGLMMIGPDKKVMAVRKPDGLIYLEELSMTRWSGLANLLFVRGSIRLFHQLVTGTRALLRSAELLDEASEPAPSPAPADAPAQEPEAPRSGKTQPAHLQGMACRR